MVTINLTEEEYIRVRDIIVARNKSVTNARRRGVPIRNSSPRIALFVLERQGDAPIATVKYITPKAVTLPSASATIPVPTSKPIPIPNSDDTIGSDSDDE